MGEPTPRPGLAQRGRRLLRAAVLAACVPAPLAALAAGEVQAQADSDALKVAFTFNFAKFTSWPRDKAQTPELRLCFERGALSERAVMMLQGKQVAERTVAAVLARPDPDRIAGCHVLFVGGRFWDGARRELLQRARTHHVLLVSDLEAFARQGGHIALETRRGRMRFSVNLAAARGAGLMLSSRMLQLARVVHR